MTSGRIDNGNSLVSESELQWVAGGRAGKENRADTKQRFPEELSQLRF